MKYAIGILVLVTCSSGLHVLRTKRQFGGEPECEAQSPDAFWMKDCNRCYCDPQTYRGVCTLRGCLSESRSEIECGGSVRWKNECNWCNCANGRAICTRKGCISGKSLLREPLELSVDLPEPVVSTLPPECQAKSANASFMIKCNRCFCDQSNTASCTKKLCPPESEDGQQCNGDVAWKRNCNWCNCYDGKAVCTEKFCLEDNTQQSSREEDESAECRFTSEASEDTRWLNRCNWCSCVKGRNRAVCTRIGCPQNYALRAGEPECKGDASWKKDCNWCDCVDGKAVCTKKQCQGTASSQTPAFSSRTIPRAASENDESAGCRPTSEGSRWRNKCNWCSCLPAQRAMCTRKGCSPDYVLRDGEAECEGDANWKRDCNWCNCVNGRAACTEKKCAVPQNIPAVEDGASEEQPLHRNSFCASFAENDSWKVDCNWCHCTDKTYVCTRKLCVPGTTEKDVGASECSGLAQWKKDCNWCKCIDGREDCTTNVCSSEGRTGEVLSGSSGSDDVCKDGSSWVQDCNTCYCRDGRVHCTEKACLDELSQEPVAKEKEEECAEGARWRKDCNWCSCSNNVAVCTKKICIPGATVTEPLCEENSEWKEDCNYCACFNSIPICTERACLEGKPPASGTESFDLRAVTKAKVEDIVNKALATDTTECVEGSRWRNDCNWCSCSKKVPVCTKKFCLPGEIMNEPLCEDNSEWKTDCNYCGCFGGTPFCTKRACLEDGDKATGIEKSLTQPRECTEGSRWKIDACNWCSCSSGRGLCTLKGCLHNIEPGAPLACEGSSEWRRSEGDLCSWCVCRDGKSVCDPIPCRDTTTEQKAVAPRGDCTEGSRWKKDACNWCNCNNGIDACTLKGCLQIIEPGAPLDCEGSSEFKRTEGDRCSWCVCRDGKSVCDPIPCKDTDEAGGERTALIPRGDCTEGSRWKKDACNWCNCNNGIGACTLIGCLQKIEPGAPLDCEGSSEFKRTEGDSCSWCVCRDGKSVCDPMPCKDTDEAGGERTALIPRGDCTEGSRWKKDACNWCNCNNGIGACTLKGCLQKIEPGAPLDCEGSSEFKRTEGDRCSWCVCRDGKSVCDPIPCKDTDEAAGERTALIPRGDCTEGSRYKMDACNWCSCYNGRGACTLKGCHQKIEPGAPLDCEGSSEFKRTEGDRCSWCVCRDGKSVCDQIPCKDTDEAGGERTALIPRGDCTEGSRWKKDACNWCNCNNGIGACTLKGCLQKIEPGAPLDCEGSSEFKRTEGDRCSWCVCRDGKSVCDPIPCKDTDEAAGERTASMPRGDCTEGSRWKLDACNWCTCYNGIGGCTKRGCLQRIEPGAPHDCEGNSEWKRSEGDRCSWCVCRDGKSVCDSIPCQGADKDKDPLPRHECTEGSRWKKDACNWCSCNNGIGVCTKRGCLQKIEPGAPLDCEGSSEWKRSEGDRCSWCVCRDGKSVCDSIPCEGTAVRERKLIPSGVDCTEGSRWMMDSCNWCFCSNGVGGCTLIGCLDRGNTRDALKCEGNSEWRTYDGDLCYWCICNDNIGVCDPVPCKASEEKSVLTRNIKPLDFEGDCTSDTGRWRDVCNWCSCYNGIGTCTRIGCSGDPGGLECTGDIQWIKYAAEGCSACQCQLEKAICEPVQCPVKGTGRHISTTETQNKKDCFPEGGRWRNKCNYCSCSNGLGICTKIACLTEIIDEPDCDGDVQWKRYAENNCSWCRCEERKAICKPVNCSDSDSAPRDEERTCTDGSRWRERCNWCHCSNGQSVCTYTACAPGVVDELDGACEANSSWKKACNWCNCVGGQAVCTQIACTGNVASVSKVTPEAPADEGQCVSGNSWTEECNTCICVNNLKVCSKIHCRSEPPKMICDEGDVWKNDCNICHCIRGEAACTRNLCVSSSETRQQLPPLCYLPVIQPGAEICGGFETKWTYNAGVGECEQIVYGGCGATENLFNTDAECQTTCSSQQAFTARRAVSKPTERCFLPIEAGPCYAYIPRYAFVKERNRCEKFLYGGCQGNQNNFVSPEDCYETCGGGLPVADTNCDRSQCDWKRYSHYLAKNCVPVYQGGSCCPTSFACKSEKEVGRLLEKCYYKDKEYNVGERILVDDPCSVGCHCVAGEPANIRCASVECPSLFQKPDPNCRLIYSEESCCSVDKECKDPDTPPELEQRATICAWKGQTWKLGDKMYFDDYPCQVCICSPAFTGPEGPKCRKVECGLDFRYRNQLTGGCTPIFFENKCCFIEWMCPNDSRLKVPVEQQLTNPALRDSSSCTIGNISVPVGSSLPVTDCHLRCRCNTPPDVTCVQYRSCDMAAESSEPQQAVPGVDCPSTKCPENCRVETEPSTGCPACICSDFNFKCPELKCPPQCINGTTIFDENTGCHRCQCECLKNSFGTPPCPSGCVVKVTRDDSIGCKVCYCDPDEVFNQQ